MEGRATMGGWTTEGWDWLGWLQSELGREAHIRGSASAIRTRAPSPAACQRMRLASSPRVPLQCRRLRSSSQAARAQASSERGEATNAETNEANGHTTGACNEEELTWGEKRARMRMRLVASQIARQILTAQDILHDFVAIHGRKAENLMPELAGDF